MSGLTMVLSGLLAALFTAAGAVTIAEYPGMRKRAARLGVSTEDLQAIGSLEIVGCLLALGEGIIPPTANLHEPDPDCDLDYVPLVAREQRVRAALTVGSGFGGFQSAMILRQMEEGVR